MNFYFSAAMLLICVDLTSACKFAKPSSSTKDDDAPEAAAAGPTTDPQAKSDANGTCTYYCTYSGQGDLSPRLVCAEDLTTMPQRGYNGAVTNAYYCRGVPLQNANNLTQPGVAAAYQFSTSTTPAGCSCTASLPCQGYILKGNASGLFNGTCYTRTPPAWEAAGG